MRSSYEQSRRIAIETFIIGLAIVASATSVYAQTTVTNVSVADSQIFGGFTTINRGAQAEMYVGDAGVGTPGSRALVQFSLANIPAGQLITSATLRLYMGGTTQYSTDGYRLLSSWLEGDGNGVSPANGTYGVTWDSRDKGGSLANWVSGGASGSGTDRAASSSFTLTASDVSGNHVFKDVTSDVQGWYNGSFSNFGWLLQATTFTSGQYTRYGTREQAGSDNDPQLIITYVPEPSSVVLLLSGFALLWYRRARE